MAEFTVPYLIAITGDNGQTRYLFPGAAGSAANFSIVTQGIRREVIVKGDGTLADTTDLLGGISLAGSAVISQSFGINTADLTTEMALGGVSGVNGIYITMQSVLQESLVTGAVFLQTVQGSFTAVDFSGFGLYQFDQATSLYMLIAQSANDANIWKHLAGVTVKVPFTTQITIEAGLYWLLAMYSSSAHVTAPRVAAAPNVIHNACSTLDFMSGVKTYQAEDTAIVNLPTQFGSYTADIRRPWFALY